MGNAAHSGCNHGGGNLFLAVNQPNRQGMAETLRDVKPNPRNPRLIKGARMEKLEEYLAEFGDLSGLVVNADGTTISGHQRTRVFKKQKGKLTILERYDPPAPDGTTARGFVELKDGSRFVYREVDWPQEKADRATIIANGQFGEWDADVLTNEWDMDIPELRDMGVPEFVFGGADVNGEDLDYSGHNKEIDTDEFEDKCSIVLNYTLEEYEQVKTALHKIAPTPEQAIWELLKL